MFFTPFSGSPLTVFCGLLVMATLGPMAHAQGHEAAKVQWHADIAAGYAELVSSSSALQQQANTFCHAGDNGNADTGDRTALQHVWLTAFQAWQTVRFVDFGPIEKDNMAWQMQFWPDSKNLIARKTDIWLIGEQPIDAQSVAADGVAAQGFPALEYLIFDPQITDGPSALPADRSCALLQAVSTHIHSNAVSLQADWTRFEPHFLSRPEYAQTTVKAAMHSLEILQQKRLAAPMGLGGKSRRNPYITDAWRSESSLTAIKSTLTGLRMYFLPGFSELMEKRGLEPLVKQFQAHLDATLERLDGMPAAMAPLLETDEGYRSLQLLYMDVDRLATLLNGTIASELGIIKGFNSSDGD